MKKIFAIMALAVSASAFAGDSATLEYQNVNALGATDQKTYGLTVKHEFSKTYAGDVAFSNTQTDQTGKLSTRLEGGLTVSAPLYSTVTGYVRGAVGQKFTNTESAGYYSVEPGMSAPVGPVTVKVGYRFRTPTDQSIADQTRTARVGVAYALSKNDTIALGFDRLRGDSTQNITKVSYTRGF